MSTDVTHTGPARPAPAAYASWRPSWLQFLQPVLILRFALATTTVMVIVQVFDWPLSFVAPVLVIALLEIPTPAPTPRDFIANLGYCVVSVVAGFVFVMLLQPYLLIFVTAYCLVVFLSVYQLNKGTPLLPRVPTASPPPSPSSPATSDASSTIFA